MKEEVKRGGGYCWFFGKKRGGENSGTARGQAISSRVSLHAREDYADLYIYHSSLKNYSRVGSPPQKRISLADFALINGKRATTYSFSFHLFPPSSFFSPPPPFFPRFFKKRWKIFHPRLRTVRGAPPSGLTEKCIKGEGDVRKVYMPVSSLFSFIQWYIIGQYFCLRFTMIKVVVVVIVTDFWLVLISLLHIKCTYGRVCLPKKRMPKGIWREVSLHEWSWILYIRFGIKQRQHRVPEKIAFSQETGGNRVEGWKLGQRQFLGETISRNEIRKRFVRKMILKLNWFVYSSNCSILQ